MKTLLLIAALFITSQAQAIAPDKRAHFLVGLGIGFSVSLGTGKVKYGFVSGCAAGAAKEARDSMGYGHVEFKDFLYTCAGAGIGSWAAGKIIGK